MPRLYKSRWPSSPITMYTCVNTPKSQMMDSSTRTRKMGLSSGNVTFQKIRQPLAPSTRADSCSSDGIVRSPASTLTATNGKPDQTTRIVISVYAGSAALVQLKAAQCAPPPSQDGHLDKNQSTTPPSGVASQTKTTLADTAGVAQASVATEDTNAAIRGPRRLSSNPTSVPTTSVSGTMTTAEIRLIRSDSQNSGSCRIWE